MVAPGAIGAAVVIFALAHRLGRWSNNRRRPKGWRTRDLNLVSRQQHEADGLQPSGAALSLDLEFQAISDAQRVNAGGMNRGNVHEDIILLVIPRDETVAFADQKEFDRTSKFLGVIAHLKTSRC
jgi:hypothetical protein